MIKKNVTVGEKTYNIDYPDECPICHRYSQIPVRLTCYRLQQKALDIVFQCGYSGCHAYFIGHYVGMDFKCLIDFVPIEPKLTQFPETIAEISPKFISIYAEAEKAKVYGLGQIAGPGYRKAFEFLVKDYAKRCSPRKATEIENEFSGQVIEKYIPDGRITSVAERALWLGNDETHYLKKWESHDIDDLILLIGLVINWIDIGIKSQAAVETMPKKK